MTVPLTRATLAHPPDGHRAGEHPDRVPRLPAVRCAGGQVLFRAEGLGLDYGRTSAFRDVDLSLHKNEVTAIIGPSGCGKTSLLTVLNRLTDLEPSARVRGSLHLCEQDVLSPDLDLIAHRRRVGMIFQKPNCFPLSIRRNIELPLKEHGLRRREERERVVERVLRDVGLWEEVAGRLDSPAQKLSGGQQQRLCIARALALEPEALLLDEPTASLDPLSGAVIEDLIRGMRGRYTVILVTHNLSQARRIADRVAVFWHLEGSGRLLESGPAAEIFAAPRHPLAAAYIAGIRG
jgi:phosphate transport system ATP-binding protein